MSQFLEFVIPEYTANTVLLTSLPEHAVCVCCLAENMRFVNLTTCKHTGFLKTFVDYQKLFSNCMICHLCHNILKKMEEFRHQVEQSIIILKKQNLDLEISKPHNFGISVIETMTITPKITESLQEHQQEHCNNKNFAITNVKVECDMETDAPLSGIKIQKETTVDHFAVKKEMNTLPIKREETEDSNFIGEKYIGILKMLMLTQEELQRERELLKVDEKYLELPFKCEMCLIGYNQEFYLRNHCEQIHDKSIGKYICGICEMVFVSEEALNPHYKRHFIRYECKFCSERYTDERTAVNHYNEEHGTHDAMEAGKYLCEMEDSGFGTHGVNKTPQVYKCDECDKQYKQRCGLYIHIQSVHNVPEDAPAPYCVTCRTHFRTNTILQQHLKHHSSHATEADRKYICDECGARFTKKTYLKGHIEWVHLKKSDHQCPQCLKILKTSRNLQRHIDFVHEKKKMPRDKICDYCGKGFTIRRYLQAHIRTHTGERPYKCSLCTATFTQSASLYNHRRLVHNPLRDDTKR